ncbi:MAG: hypothetical protein CMK71_11205 [Pseudomonadaceae bacterium]|nr:hypothetical protein [Pseudomonadaceae bacterium]
MASTCRAYCENGVFCAYLSAEALRAGFSESPPPLRVPQGGRLLAAARESGAFAASDPRHLPRGTGAAWVVGWGSGTLEVGSLSLDVDSLPPFEEEEEAWAGVVSPLESARLLRDLHDDGGAPLPDPAVSRAEFARRFTQLSPLLGRVGAFRAHNEACAPLRELLRPRVSPGLGALARVLCSMVDERFDELLQGATLREAARDDLFDHM